jgi:hypothetical protein
VTGGVTVLCGRAPRYHGSGGTCSSTGSDAICPGRFHLEDVVVALPVDQLVLGIDAGAGRLSASAKLRREKGDADRLLATPDAVAFQVERLAEAFVAAGREDTDRVIRREAP